MKKYERRVVDEELEKKLVVGAVLIKGAKWCGKTWTAQEHAKSWLLMDDPEKKEQNIALAKNSPTLALRGETPRLIDEWQLVPKLWDAVRFEVDRRGEGGQFILTGSAVPGEMSEVSHSGVGRITTLTMRPMSLMESGESNGMVSLRRLFEGEREVSGTSELGLEEIAFCTCRGGWPRATLAKGEGALTLAESYFEGVTDSDIMRVDGVGRSASTARRIMRAYARNLGQQVSLEKIKMDAEAGDGVRPGIDTVYDYIEALRKIFVIEDAPAWNPNLRSKAAIRTSDTRYFVDPSIAAEALETRPADLIGDLKTFGFLFESLCVRDLRIYAQASGKTVSHYRDSNGLECDAVVHGRDGKFGLVQIKLGSDQETLDEAARTLRNLGEKIDEQKTGELAFMMILAGNCPYAYRREDGVLVVPVGCLGV